MSMAAAMMQLKASQTLVEASFASPEVLNAPSPMPVHSLSSYKMLVF